jgi:hypothetical protein
MSHEASDIIAETARDMRRLFRRARAEALGTFCGCEERCADCAAAVARADLGMKIADAIETVPKGFATWARIILREDLP